MKRILHDRDLRLQAEGLCEELIMIIISGIIRPVSIPVKILVAIQFD
jgi:hypothetical protein